MPGWTSTAIIPAGSTDDQRDAILNAMTLTGDTSADAGDQLGDCQNATMALIECPNDTAAHVSFSGTVGERVDIAVIWGKG